MKTYQQSIAAAVKKPDANRQEFTFANADKSITVTTWAASLAQARAIVRGVQQLAPQGILQGVLV